MATELNIWRDIIAKRGTQGIAPAAALDSLEQALQQSSGERRALAEQLAGRTPTEVEAARLALLSERIRRTRQQADTVRACAALQRAEAAALGEYSGGPSFATARDAWRRMRGAGRRD